MEIVVVARQDALSRLSHHDYDMSEVSLASKLQRVMTRLEAEKSRSVANVTPFLEKDAWLVDNLVRRDASAACLVHNRGSKRRASFREMQIIHRIDVEPKF
jgi:hypothetical protein